MFNRWSTSHVVHMLRLLRSTISLLILINMFCHLINYLCLFCSWQSPSLPRCILNCPRVHEGITENSFDFIDISLTDYYPELYNVSCSFPPAGRSHYEPLTGKTWGCFWTTPLTVNQSEETQCVCQFVFAYMSATVFKDKLCALCASWNQISS